MHAKLTESLIKISGRRVMPEMERDGINALQFFVFFFFKLPLPEDAHSTVLCER
jgi:hypothetical protein